MGQSAPAGRRIFFLDSWRPAGASVGTAWNSSQKCLHPTTQRNGNCSQGGWGRNRRASHINVSLKCFTHCITNAMGDAMCEAFSLDSSVDPRATPSPPKAGAKNHPMMSDEARGHDGCDSFVLPPPPLRQRICPLVPPVVRVPHRPSCCVLFHLLLTTRSLGRRATDDGR